MQFNSAVFRQLVGVVPFLFLLLAPCAGTRADDGIWVRIDRPKVSLERSAGLEDYGTFAWGRVDTGQLRALQSQGERITIVERPFELALGGMRFDPLTDFPALASSARQSRGAEPTFHLIQFQGPVRGEWLAGVRGQGMEIVQYIHPFTYVVWGDQARLNSASRAAGVRWAGEFAAEFRVLPHLRGRDASVVPVMALVSRYANESVLRRQLETAGAAVYDLTPVTAHTSVVHLDIPGNRLPDLGRIPGVYTVQDIPQDGGPRGEMTNQAVANPAYATNQDIEPGYQDWLDTSGYDGAGVTVAVVDGGIRTTHLDLVDNIADCESAEETTTSCSTSNDDHGTHVAAAVAGTGASGIEDASGFLRGQGIAPGARVVQQRYIPFLGGGGPDGMIPDGMLTIFRESVLSGAQLVNNSWGPSGTPQGYNIVAQQVDIVTRDADPETQGHQPVLLVWSIMNGGGDSSGSCAPSSLGSPDEAKNLFGVGSTELVPGTYIGGTIPDPSDLYGVSYNSAHGPACDGRTGLHIVAPGCGTDSSDSGSDTAHVLKCGTSMASPVVSGAAAIFIERYRDLFDADPSPALIKAALTTVAVNMHGHTNAGGGQITETPSRFQGYGRLDLDAVVNPPSEVYYFDQAKVFTETGQAWDKTFIADDPEKPVRVMLMWTDAHGPGLGGDTPAWVNDLDLSVEIGDDTYLGNILGADGFSETGGRADARNNAEAVFLRGDQHDGDTFSISVLASEIAGDALNPHDPDAENPNQDFALVCYNCREAGFTVEPAPASVCTDDGSAAFTLTLSESFNGTTWLSGGGEPAGTSGLFDPNPVIAPDEESIYTLSGLEQAAVGDYVLEITATDDQDSEITGTAEVGLTLYADTPGAVSLAEPAHGATGVDFEPAFTWSEIDSGAYHIQIATDAEFANLVADETLTNASFVPAEALADGTGYFWRVRADNACGEGDWSPVFEFRTRFLAAQLEVEPATLDFGDVGVNAGATGTITVRNVADEHLALELSAIDLNGNGFALAGGDCAAGDELEGGAGCAIEVSFDPVAQSAYAGVVAVSATDGEETTIELIELSGRGAEPAPEIFTDRFEQVSP